MSRTITEIYDTIIAEKQSLSALDELQPNIDSSQTLLNDLTSTSKVAIWRLFIFLFSTAVWMHEQIFDKFKEEVDERVKDASTGNIRWYWKQAFLFQFGDSLSYIDNKYQYATIDETKKIVERASVFEVGSQLRMKVAKLDSVGAPVPLSSVELTAFNDYMNKIKFAGTNVAIISSLPDQIQIYYSITVNQQVLSLTGESLSAPGTYPVEDVINKYIKDLPFDGVLNFTKLTDKIQEVDGVIDPVYGKSGASYGSLPFQEIVKNYYQPNAGHLVVAPTNPLSQTITYK